MCDVIRIVVPLSTATSSNLYMKVIAAHVSHDFLACNIAISSYVSWHKGPWLTKRSRLRRATAVTAAVGQQEKIKPGSNGMMMARDTRRAGNEMSG